MRGHYGYRVGAEAMAAPAQPKSPSTLPVTLMIMGGLTAVMVAVLRDEAKASR